MIEVPMIDDIRQYETKFLGPFTKKQLIYTIIAVIVCAPLFFLMFMTKMDLVFKILLPLLPAIPIELAGIVNINNTPLEAFALRVIYNKILTPAKRKNKSESDIHKNFRKKNALSADPTKPPKIKYNHKDFKYFT